MWYTEYVPSFAALAGMIGLKLGSFENQRWTRAIRSGRRGSSDAITIFALATEIAVVIFLIGVLVSLSWYGEWKLLAGVSLIWIVGGMLVGVIWTMLVRDHFIIHLVGAIVCWPSAIVFAAELKKIIG